MTWLTTKAKLLFKQSSMNWGEDPGTVGAVDAATQTIITDILEILYAAPTAAQVMEDILLTMPNIKIGISLTSAPAFFQRTQNLSDGFIAIRFDLIDKTHYINSNGELVKEKRELAVIHELIHLTGKDDPVFDPLLANFSSYKFDGEVIPIQNTIASELGLTNNIQRSYDTGILESDPRFSLLVVGTSYTDGREIEVARFGDNHPIFVNDIIDMTLHDYSNDLIFGFDGDDVIYGALSDDFLYGGGDLTKPNSGRDKLYGGAGSDRLYGADGNDFLDSGLTIVDPETWEFYDFLDGGDDDDILILRGEMIEAQGGTGDDQFWVVSIPSFGSFISILDSESSDELYCDGYRLLGGTKSVVEYELMPEGGFHHIAVADSYGFLYYFIDGSLSISTPRGGVIQIANFANGDFGISAGDEIEESDFVWEWDHETSGWTYQTSLQFADDQHRRDLGRGDAHRLFEHDLQRRPERAADHLVALVLQPA